MYELIAAIRKMASSLGMSAEQVEYEVRCLAQGTLNVRTCKIATALGITNK